MPSAEHVDYPHQPGYLYDCPGCELECNCVHMQDDMICLHCSIVVIRERGSND